jgi:vancomycin permeability regulator SanA
MKGKRWRWVVVAVVALLVLDLGCVIWTRVASAGHIHAVGNAPKAGTVIVFGAQLADNRTEPRKVLRNRLDTALQLYAAGKAEQILVSGDAGGTSGDETAAMTNYLVAHGVPPDRIVVDKLGLDTYETCTRAKEKFGLTKVVLVSQGFHLYRATAICRSVGVDADGVLAGCADCDGLKLVWNTVRDWLAAPKAVAEVVLGGGGM